MHSPRARTTSASLHTQIALNGAAPADSVDHLGVHAVSQSTIAGVTANFGAGSYTLDLGGGSAVRLGAVNVQAANQTALDMDTVNLGQTTYTGAVKINTGNGPDTITVADAVFAGAFTLGTLGGADVVNIETAMLSSPPSSAVP